MPLLLLLGCLSVAAGQPVSTLFDVQGHRGCRGLMPENTIPAFLKALDLGVTTLELDVVISRDSQVVVSHEPYMSARYVTHPNVTFVRKKDERQLYLYTMTYDSIRRFDVGIRGNPAFPQQQKISAYKPLLSEVIDRAEAYRKARNLPDFTYSIEIKSSPAEYGSRQPEPAVFSDRVQAVLHHFTSLRPNDSMFVSPDRLIIQSFDFAVLRYWHQQMQAGRYPTVRLSALVGNLHSLEKNLTKLGFSPAIYSPHYRLLNRRKVTRLHAKNIRVIPWTVNRRTDMERLRTWGVDGLISDYPDRATGL